MSRWCFQTSEKESHELNIKQKSECEFPNCDEPMSCWHSAIRLLGENKSRPLSLPSFWGCRGTKARLFIFISIIILPQKHSLFSILNPLSTQAGGSPFMTIWQGAPSAAEGLESCCVALLHLVQQNLLWLRADSWTLILFVLGLKLHLCSSRWYISLKGIKMHQLVVSTGTYFELRNPVIFASKL